jgi:hypothetical protein
VLWCGVLCCGVVCVQMFPAIPVSVIESTLVKTKNKTHDAILQLLSYTPDEDPAPAPPTKPADTAPAAKPADDGKGPAAPAPAPAPAAVPAKKAVRKSGSRIDLDSGVVLFRGVLDDSEQERIFRQCIDFDEEKDPKKRLSAAVAKVGKPHMNLQANWQAGKKTFEGTELIALAKDLIMQATGKDSDKPNTEERCKSLIALWARGRGWGWKGMGMGIAMAMMSALTDWPFCTVLCLCACVCVV